MISVTHNDLLLYISTRIRKIRTELGLAIRDLADKVGISYLTTQKIETDEISPSVVILSITVVLLLYSTRTHFPVQKKLEEE
jgi:transcriptional regulator with XRE-family HTH domain